MFDDAGAGDFVFRHHLLHRGADSGEYRFGGENGPCKAKRGEECAVDGEAAGVHAKVMDLATLRLACATQFFHLLPAAFICE